MKKVCPVGFNQEKVLFWINLFALALIGLVCLGYVIFVRNFAELHFLLPFFNGLPVFVGEILWFICFFIIIIEISLFRKVIKYSFCDKNIFWFWFAVVFYLIWVFLKTIFGVAQYGPLAFRHAALFYYPLFAVFSFLFFDRKFFSRGVLFFLTIVIIFIFAYRQYNNYWTFTLAGLGFILILRFKMQLRLLMAALIFIVIPYFAFFSTSRMMIVSNAFSFVILVVGLWKVLAFKKMQKIFILVFFIVGVISMAYYSFFVKTPERVFVNPKVLFEKYCELEKEIQKKKKFYKKVPIFSKLYSPEQAKNSSQGLESLKKTSSLIEPNEIIEMPHIKFIRAEEKAAMLSKEAKGIDSLDRTVGSVLTSRFDVSGKAESLAEKQRTVEGESLSNALFRFFIWRDMWQEWWQSKPFLGFNFGYPLRPQSLEILCWGYTNWMTLGWLEPHNSYFHILYRAGIFGILFVGMILGFAVWLLVKAFAMRSLTSVFLAAIIWNWIIAGNFLINFEVPYMAIPFWTLFGMSIAYIKSKDF